MEIMQGTEDHPIAEGQHKDLRGVKKIEEDAKAHHVLLERTGPSVIIRSQHGGITNARTSSLDSEDIFEINCDNIAHSLNKRKRWEKTQNAEQFIYDENRMGKISFVEASIPRPLHSHLLSTSDIENGQLVKNKGGIKKYFEVEKGEISVRVAKSNRANLSSLQDNAGPGPLLRMNRKRTRTVEKRMKEGRPDEVPQAEHHIRYSTIEVERRNPKNVERTWRRNQTQRSKQGWTRKHAADHLLDWYSEQQDDLEAELNSRYENLFEKEDSLSFTGHCDETFEKQPKLTKDDGRSKLSGRVGMIQRRNTHTSISKNDQDRSASQHSFLSSARLVERIHEKAKNYFNKQKVSRHLRRYCFTTIHQNETAKILGVKLNSMCCGEGFYSNDTLDVHCIEKYLAHTSNKKGQSLEQAIELRPLLTLTNHIEEVFVRAKEHFNNKKIDDCLPVFPRTIVVHKEESEKILGTKLDRCVFVASSSIPGEVNLQAAPGFCCNIVPPVALPVNGWQSHAKNELETLEVQQSNHIPTSSLSECPLCKKNEETEELEDIAIVKPPSLFSFSCGHVACHSCWLAHARKEARTRSTLIHCINSHCSHLPTSTELAALYSDGTIELFHSLWWDSLCGQKNAVHCHSCQRILIPLMSSVSLTAVCVCGARTCSRCGLREHLPLSCSDYNRWAAMCTREGLNNPMIPYIPHCRPLKHDERISRRNCWFCPVQATLLRKNWCDKCCKQITIRKGDPVKSRQDLVSILETRGRMMNGEYRQAETDCRLSNEKSEMMKKLIEEGVFLLELIKISRFVGIQMMIPRKMDRMARIQFEQLENSLGDVLFASLETREDQKKKFVELKSAIEAIRYFYYQLM